MAEMALLVRALCRTARGTGYTLALQNCSTFLATVVLLTYFSEIMPLVRASGGTTRGGRGAISFHHSSTFAALIVPQIAADCGESKEDKCYTDD